MSLSPVRPGLRTIHNGSNGVAKVSIVVDVGAELTVSDDLAAQFQRASSAFKDGEAPKVVVADDPAPVARKVKR